MAFSVQMPALGESVTEGTVTRWLKHEGDQVAVDEPLLEVSTDKVDTEIPSPAAGVLRRIVVAEDQTAEVGAELAVIDDAADRQGAAEQQPAEAPQRQADQPADRAEPEQAEEAEEAEPVPQAEQRPQGQPEREPEQEAAPPQPARGEREAAPPAQAGGGTPVTMPALGESVTEGTVTRWLKQVGDKVEVDEPLLEISTDKVDTEIPSPVAGTLLEINVDADQTVEVGATLAMIGSGQPTGGQQTAEQAPAREERAEEAEPEPHTPPQPAPGTSGPAETAQRERPAPAEQVEQQPGAPTPAPPAPGPAPETQAEAHPDGAPYVTPLVRRLAAEHDVDLAGITGTGVGGRIRKQDVLAAAEAAKAAQVRPEPATAPAGGAVPPVATTAEAAGALRGTTQKMSRLRQLIAKRMVESLQTSAQLTSVVEVDVTKIAVLRDRAKREFEAREGVKLSFLPFFAKAAVEALKQHPRLNASIDDETKEVTYHGAEHLSIAVDTERGLSAPVIHNAGDLNIAGLARRIADLAERTRTNKITPDELAGGTFTVTNTGSRGALFDTPIINQPQVAILGTGAVVKRAVVRSDEAGDVIAIRHMAYLALSYDHRLVDGADAARFLMTLKRRLEEGNFESDLGL